MTLLGTARISPSDDPRFTVLAALATMLVAILIAIAFTMAPTLVLLLAIAAVTVAVLALAPTWVLAPAVLLASIVAELVRLELFDSGQDGLAGMIGQGRVVALIAIVAIFRMLIARSSLNVPGRVAFVIGLFVLTSLFAAILAARDPLSTVDVWTEFQRDISYMTAFIIGLVVMQSERPMRALYAIAVVAALSATASIVFWAWQEGYIAAPPGFLKIFELTLENQLQPGRVAFPFTSLEANLSAVVFVMLGAISLPVLARLRSRWSAVLSVVCILLIVAAVLTTQSRTGLGALAIAAVVFFLVVRGVPGSTRLTLLIGAIAAGVIGAVIYSTLPDSRELGDTETIDIRLTIWREALHDFGESPLIGHGLDFSAVGRYSSQGIQVHNEFLGQLVDGGLIGATSFLLLLGTFAVIGWQLARREGIDAPLGAGLFTAIVALMVGMATNPVWNTGSVPQILSWLVFGMATAAYAVGLRRDRSPRGEPLVAVRPMQSGPRAAARPPAPPRLAPRPLGRGEPPRPR